MDFYMKISKCYISSSSEWNEFKFNGETRIFERKHVPADSIVYIGKEANIID